MCTWIIYVYILIYVYMNMSGYTYTYVYICIHINTYIHMYTYLYMCMYTYVYCIHICVLTCMWLWILIQVYIYEHCTDVHHNISTSRHTHTRMSHVTKGLIKDLDLDAPYVVGTVHHFLRFARLVWGGSNGLLQCVAVCCSVLQCVAEWFEVHLMGSHSFLSDLTEGERWGAGVEYHFQEI